MISEEKQRLRAAMRGRTVPASYAGVEARSALDGWERWEAAKNVCAFHPIRGEVDLLQNWPAGKRLALPRIEGYSLVFHWVDTLEALVAGPYGIREPAAGLPLAGHRFDLLFVPGLAFDRHGGRLGRGRGFYDRFLRSASGVLVGACHPSQLVDAVPCEEHDIRMDFLLTADGLIDCGRLTR